MRVTDEAARVNKQKKMFVRPELRRDWPLAELTAQVGGSSGGSPIGGSAAAPIASGMFGSGARGVRSPFPG